MSWFDAVAFGRWLSARLSGELPSGYAIRLPLEWEWQQAATGGDPSREYPAAYGSTTEVTRPIAAWGGSLPLDSILMELGLTVPSTGREVLDGANQHNLNRQGRPSGGEAQWRSGGGSWRIGRHPPAAQQGSVTTRAGATLALASGYSLPGLTDASFPHPD